MHEWNDAYEKIYSFSLLFFPTCFVMKGRILSILGFWKYALVFCVHQLLPTAPRLGHNFHCRSYLLLSSSLRSSPSTLFIIIIITWPKPAYGRQGLAGGSLRASGAQLGSGKWSFFVTDTHCIIIYISSSSFLWVPYDHHHLYYRYLEIFEDSEWARAAVKMTNRPKEHKRRANEDPRPKFVKTHLTFLPFSQTAAAVIWEFFPKYRCRLPPALFCHWGFSGW